MSCIVNPLSQTFLTSVSILNSSGLIFGKHLWSNKCDVDIFIISLMFARLFGHDGFNLCIRFFVSAL